jgi:protease-4
MFIFRWIKSILTLFRDYFKSFLLILIAIWLFSPSDEELESLNYNLAKVYLTGTILDTTLIVEELREVLDDDSIKGLLLIVDSGGGAVSGSIEISDIVKRIREKKPVVVYASGTLASGSYYSSIWSNHIVANRGSIVGSIGVIFDGVNYRELSEKLGVSPQTLTAGKYKEVGTASRDWLPHEKAEMEKVIDDMYQTFVSDVAEARNLDINKSADFADAHIFTARQALKVGLIDSLGTVIEAEKVLEDLTSLPNPIWEKESEFDKFMKDFSSNLADGVLSNLTPQFR